MLRLEELAEMSGSTNGKRTLSAYVPVEGDTRNPGVAWRTLLRQGIARAREQIVDAPHDEKTAFDACAARLMERADEDMHAQGGGTWIGIASTDDFLHDETVPTLLPPLVTWEPTARIAPYLAALEPDSALIVVVDRVHAIFFRLKGSSLEEIDRIETEPRGGVGTHMSNPPKQSFHSGTRGTPGTDVAARKAVAAFKKHRLAIMERLKAHDHDGESIVLGGAHEAVTQIAPVIEEHAKGRFFVTHTLTMNTSESELRAAVKEGLAELTQQRQTALISALLSGDRHPELNVLDRAELKEALTLRNVDTLVLSRRWMAENADEAEEIVKQAIAQDGSIEIADGNAGEMLDAGCGGVAAKLRFSVKPV